MTIKKFQSTHPVWGGTLVYPVILQELYGISIHPPRVGWDLFDPDGEVPDLDFNPPTPCGVGPVEAPLNHHYEIFQSTHPVWGGTQS